MNDEQEKREQTKYKLIIAGAMLLTTLITTTCGLLIIANNWSQSNRMDEEREELAQKYAQQNKTNIRIGKRATVNPQPSLTPSPTPAENPWVKIALKGVQSVIPTVPIMIMLLILILFTIMLSLRPVSSSLDLSANQFNQYEIYLYRSIP